MRLRCAPQHPLLRSPPQSEGPEHHLILAMALNSALVCREEEEEEDYGRWELLAQAGSCLGAAAPKGASALAQQKSSPHQADPSHKHPLL